MANPDITGEGSGETQVQAAAAAYKDKTGNNVTYTTASDITAQANLSNGEIDFAISPTFNGIPAISNIPLLFSPIAIVYGVGGVKTLRLSSNTLAEIFAGTITKWNDPKIKAENQRMAKVTLPDTAIKVLYPSSNMDETYGFTNYLHKTSPEIWTKPASTSFSSAFPTTIPESFQSSTSTEALAKVKKTNGAITFMGFEEASRNKLTTAYIKNSDDKYVKPTSATATKFISKAASISAITGEVTFDYAKENIARGYPIVAVYYGLWSTSTDKNSAVKAFFDYLVTDYIKTKSKYYAKTSGNNQTKIVELINNITNS